MRVPAAAVEALARPDWPSLKLGPGEGQPLIYSALGTWAFGPALRQGGLARGAKRWVLVLNKNHW